MRIVGNPPSGGKQPTTPTIGTATDGGTGTTVSVAFTPSTYIGKGTITYTATSSPGSLTGTGSGSPITVSGLTTGTTYSFTVAGTTNYGVSSLSSAQSNFVTPVPPSSFESISTVTATGGETSFTFSSISGTYKHLQIRGIQRRNAAGTAVTGVRINGITTSTYVYHTLYGDGASVIADASTAANYLRGPRMASATNAASIYGAFVFDVIDYASTTKNKTVRWFGGYDANGTGIIELKSGLFNNTAAVTSITVYFAGDAVAAGSTFALYGIKG